MTTLDIRGVPVTFPFEPYELQKNYMEKVIEALQNETNAILESPTGTGKTLSLLCSTLAWLQMKKAHVQAERQVLNFNDGSNFGEKLKGQLEGITDPSAIGRILSGIPLVIYASRTHSQLAQAMQELKRTAYKHMNAVILGSRDQLCVHEELSQEQSNSIKTHMCRLKVQTRSCHYFNRVDRHKDNPDLKNLSIVDIEDIVRLGKSYKFCPYYMTKELKAHADIIFMPYNYLLDPSLSKGVELANSIVILDEAHNVEKMCEEAASVQLKSSDIALAIDEVTAIMKLLADEVLNFDDTPKDFTLDDVCTLKQMLLDLEKAIDDINVGSDGQTFDGTYIFELLGKIGIQWGIHNKILSLLENIIQFLSTTSDGPFARKGNGLQHLEEVLRVIFLSNSEDFMQKVQKCCKVHVVEEVKKKKADNWLTKITNKSGGKILNYWCFSPGFGMNMFMKSGLRSLILTSGTLAPLRPLISELELKVDGQLENPHIVTVEQVCVKIVPAGPDKQPLNCSFQNRNNDDFIRSLGMSILNLTKVIPDGLLIFFPSYPVMQNCQENWQLKGIWSNIFAQKPIFVEPRDKSSFSSVMQEYYERISDPAYKGAIFMGVCRGKVSEGLDFVDTNGRAVIIIGLPYPPFKDPRIILKRKYLDACNAKDKEYLRGEEWYSLEATRAVNQAIGRVIRHRNDYGAILLLDSRFNNPRVKDQMSKWLRNHIKVANNFGELMRDIRVFFKNAELKFPCDGSRLKRNSSAVPAEFDTSKIYKGNAEASTSSTSMPSSSSSNGEVTIHQKNHSNPYKRMKVTMTKQNFLNIKEEDEETNEQDKATVMKEYIAMVKKSLTTPEYQSFIAALRNYKDTSNFDSLTNGLDEIFKGKFHLRYLILGLGTYIKPKHKKYFQTYCEGNV